MKKMFFILSVLVSTVSYSQVKSTHLSINGGISSPFGDYASLAFNKQKFNEYKHPIEGVGAYGGYSIGFSTDYNFSKYVGLSLDWNYMSNNLKTVSRGDLFKNEGYGEYFGSYEAHVSNWSFNMLNIGGQLTLPLAKDKLLINVKSQIGFSNYSIPKIQDIVYLTDGSIDEYEYGGENKISLSTKLEFNMKYFIKDFGVGFYVNYINIRSSGDKTTTYNNFYDGTNTYTTVSETTNDFDCSTINYGINITYRLKKK